VSSEFLTTGTVGLTEAAEVLARGVLEPEGRILGASNATLRCRITLEGVSARCVYKPVAGERPLWDFPDGTLAGREVAAWLVSEATGWGLVPPTVLRDGPLGPGACQLWLEAADHEEVVGFVPAEAVPPGWHRIADAEDTDGRPYVLAHADDVRLGRMAILDAIINNADRKGGHILVTAAGEVFGVDHGVCFHTEPKLRTVLWGWIGRRLPDDAEPVLARLDERLRGDLGAALAEHLTRPEIAATAARLRRLRGSRRFAAPSPDWPSVPWPPV
jgi:uncharacterized repeat protein (TIGR03843 family)